MKRRKSIYSFFLSVMVLFSMFTWFLSGNIVYAKPSWVPVGTLGFSAGPTYVSFVIDNSTPYITFADDWNNSRERLVTDNAT